MRNKREAFTMIELILVIVVMGIIAANAIPRLKRDTRAEAINHMLTMIRYTQNLALHDSKHSGIAPAGSDPTKWQRSFWRFKIYSCEDDDNELFYTIGTKLNFRTGQIADSEAAIDPSNGKIMNWSWSDPCPKNANNIDKASPNIFITQKYGINKVVFKECDVMRNGATSTRGDKDDGGHISFDNFGRPYRGIMSAGDDTMRPIYNFLTKEDCNITFSFQDTSIRPFTIVIPPETGYAYLEENPDL